ncbi:hypothetical protein [Brachyspira pilosicoli]|uniref:hypothetical protein n=1 Tax=Brachyspira pilosicoli TaxID=52584 RepID=UPI00254308E5|nr:hypothetical protein [Brachyspira pilosicoli]WIH87732.1 hypothetical protein NEI05_09570 [Brachyspira pilosicoli]
MKYKLYSFDVFDTIVTRKTATPYGIFAIMQNKLLSGNYNIENFIKNNFSLIRISTEKYLRKMYDKDINIYDIYNDISHNYFLSEYEKNLLIDMECNLEIENSIPIKFNINKVIELYNNKDNIILISDMYLPSEIIRKILLKHSQIFSDIPIYVSNEYNKSKNLGNMYEFIKDSLGIKFDEWIHTGDNINSDIIKAKEYLINTNYFKSSMLYNFEKEILQYYNHNIEIELFIGSIKNLRIEYNFNCNIPLNIGISFGGPILFFYVEWIIKSCISQKIKNIYFISRDGFVLKNIADIIIYIKNIKNINTHYLYSSRYAWQFPGIYANLPIPEFIFYEINILKDLEYFFKVDINKILTLLPEKYNDINMVVNHEDKVIIKDILSNSNEFRKMVIKQSENSYMILLKYLEQEIDFTETFCFVDTRGNGTTMYYISKILEEKLNEKLEVFYIDTWSVSNNQFINKRCFFNGDFIHSDKIELLARAEHGEVIGYREYDNKVVPIFSDGDINNLIDINYIDYINGINIFTEHYSNQKIKYIHSIDLFTTYNRFLNNIIDMDINNYLNSIQNFRIVTHKNNFSANCYYISKKFDNNSINLLNNKTEELKLNLYWFSLLSIFGIHLFALSNNSDYFRITILGIKLTFRVNEESVNKIAWWIPVKKLRDSFRSKFKMRLK